MVSARFVTGNMLSGILKFPGISNIRGELWFDWVCCPAADVTGILGSLNLFFPFTFDKVG